jgi:hypothetical protein
MVKVICQPQSRIKRNIPYVGYQIAQDFVRGSSISKTTGHVPEKTAGRSHVSTVRKKGGDQRLDPAQTGVGRTERNLENVGADL